MAPSEPLQICQMNDNPGLPLLICMLDRVIIHVVVRFDITVAHLSLGPLVSKVKVMEKKHKRCYDLNDLGLA